MPPTRQEALAPRVALRSRCVRWILVDYRCPTRCLAPNDREVLAVHRYVVHRVHSARIGRLEQDRLPADRWRDINPGHAEPHGHERVAAPVVELSAVTAPYRMDAASVRHGDASRWSGIRIEVDLSVARRVRCVRDPATVGRDAPR